LKGIASNLEVGKKRKMMLGLTKINTGEGRDVTIR